MPPGIQSLAYAMPFNLHVGCGASHATAGYEAVRLGTGLPTEMEGHQPGATWVSEHFIPILHYVV